MPPAALSKAPNPVAQLEIGQEQQADEAERRVNNGRAGCTQHPETVLVSDKPQPAARARAADSIVQVAKPARVVHDVKQARQRHAAALPTTAVTRTAAR